MADTKYQDPIEYGQETAKENHEKEDHSTEENRFDEIVDEARETAKINHDAEQENVVAGQEHIPQNDTSKKAKTATAKSQLDPNGDDPISQKEVADSATDADMTTGNKTTVSNKQQADRAHNPKNTDMKDAPRTLVGETTDPQNSTVETVSENSTSNRDQVKEVLSTQKKANKN